MSRILSDNITKMWEEAEGATRPRVASNGDLTFHINHPDCPAGEDKRRRLYLTEEASTGTILAYCHNCGSAGVSKNNEDVTHVNKELGLSRPTVPHREPTSIITFDEWDNSAVFRRGPWSGDVQSYIRDFLDPVNLEPYGFRQISSWQYAYPLYITDEWNTWGGIQIRSLRGGEPKYKTLLVRDFYERSLHPPRYTFGYDSPEMCDDALIIVEDAISACKIWSAQEVNSVAAVYGLLGSHLTNGEILDISKKFSKVLIWLDNDNDVVLQEVKRISELLACLGVEVHRYPTTPALQTDPKLFTCDYINSFLKKLGFA